MDKLKIEYTNFRARIFCQDIDSSQIKQFSEKVKHQLSSMEGERNPFELICVLESMHNHNQSINTGAAPTIDTLHLFDLNLTLNQLQQLKRCIQKLEYPQQILDSLNFLLSFLFSHNNKLFLMNCKIINDILFHYKKTLKLKNEEYQQRSLEQIIQVLDYGKKSNSTLLIENIQHNNIDFSIRQLAQSDGINPEIKQKCSEVIKEYFEDEDDYQSDSDEQILLE